MDPSALDGYLREICQQCWLALLASMRLHDLLKFGAEHLIRLRRPDAHEYDDLLELCSEGELGDLLMLEAVKAGA